MKNGYTIKSPPCFAQWTKYLFEVDKYGNQETHSVHAKFDGENWKQFLNQVQGHVGMQSWNKCKLHFKDPDHEKSDGKHYSVKFKCKAMLQTSQGLLEQRPDVVDEKGKLYKGVVEGASCRMAYTPIAYTKVSVISLILRKVIVLSPPKNFVDGDGTAQTNEEYLESLKKKKKGIKYQDAEGNPLNGEVDAQAYASHHGVTLESLEVNI